MAPKSMLAFLTALPITALAAATPSPAYTYQGCVVAPDSAFPHVVPGFVEGEPMIPFKCRDACAAVGRVAALGGGVCRCSTAGQYPSGTTFQTVDDSQCMFSCVESAGFCGGAPGSSAWSVFVRDYPADHRSKRHMGEEHEGDEEKGAEEVKEDPVEDEECDDDDDDSDGYPGGVTPVEPGKGSPVVTTIITTVTSCPPEVESCPARVETTVSTLGSFPTGVPDSGVYHSNGTGVFNSPTSPLTGPDSEVPAAGARRAGSNIWMGASALGMVLAAAVMA